MTEIEVLDADSNKKNKPHSPADESAPAGVQTYMHKLTIHLHDSLLVRLTCNHHLWIYAVLFRWSVQVCARVTACLYECCNVQSTFSRFLTAQQATTSLSVGSVCLLSSLSLQLLHVPGCLFLFSLSQSHIYGSLKSPEISRPYSPSLSLELKRKLAQTVSPPLSLQLKRWGVFCSRASVPLISPLLFLLPASLSPSVTSQMKTACVSNSVIFFAGW